MLLVAVTGYFALRWVGAAGVPPLPPIVEVMAGPADWPPDSATLGGLRDDWTPRTLPIRTCKIKCETPYVGYAYRFTVDGTAQNRWGVYVRRADSNVAAYLNGQLIGLRGRMEMPPSSIRTAQLFEFPATLLRPGANVLVLIVVRELRGFGGLSPFHIGELEQLQPALQSRRFLTEDLPYGVSWLHGASALIALGLLLAGRREPVMIWYTVSAAFWLLYTLLGQIPDWPADPLARQQWMWLSSLGCMCFTTLFGVSLHDKPPRTAVVLLIAIFVLGIANVAAAGSLPGLDWYTRLIWPQYYVKWSGYVLIPVAFFAISRYAARSLRPVNAGWVAAMFVLPALLGIGDMLNGPGVLEFALSPISGLGITAAFWLELSRRIQDNARRMAAFNSELENTVRERELQLRNSFQQLGEVERARTLAEERTRIMRDMHDGVGGQLTLLLGVVADEQVSREEIARQLQQSLEDLRLVVDSLQASPGNDLLETLGIFRERVEPRLRQAGLSLHWRANPDLELPGFGPEAALKLFRILQEALSNVLRHAQARNIELRVTADARDLVIDVADDGHGLPEPAPRRGQGLRNIRARIAELGGTLRIESAAGKGTCLQIRVPQAVHA